MAKPLTTKKCIVCGNTFKAKRSDAKTCSPNCRKNLSNGKTRALADIGQYVVSGSQTGLHAIRRSWPQHGNNEQPVYYAHGRHICNFWDNWYGASRHTFKEAERIIRQEKKHFLNATWEIVDYSQLIAKHVAMAADLDRAKAEAAEAERNRPVLKESSHNPNHYD